MVPVPNRKYDSSRRKEQARQTRSLIISTARSLFLERGYSRTTIESIAAQAGVAVETVYAAFTNKLNILRQVVHVSVVGDDRPVPLLERSGPQTVSAMHDPHEQILLFSHHIAEIMQRTAPIFMILNAASQSEPEIAILLADMLDGRMDGMRFFIRALSTNTSLRPAVSEASSGATSPAGGAAVSGATSPALNPDLAAETVWAVTSAEVFSLLTVTRGWSVETYEAWLADSLTRLLLA